jgi:hypothetical protein
MAMTFKSKAKPKQQKVGRSVAKAADLKAFGDEPIIIGEIDKMKAIKAFNWYNYFHDKTQAKKWLLEYLKQKKYDKNLISAIRTSPDWVTSTTTGWMARMMINGTMFDSAMMSRFNQSIDLNAKSAIKEEDVAEPKPVVSIQDRVKKANDKILSDAEAEVIDNRKSMYDFLVGNTVTPAAAKNMLSHYQRLYDEVMSDDPQVKEAFGKSLKTERAFLQTVVDDLNRYIGNKKVVKVRKPREKKVKPIIEQIKNLKYQKEFPPLKIVSVNPIDLVGANQVWTYNTKYKKLTRYDSAGPTGIQVKGTTLIGFNAETSCTKSLRKPDVTIQALLGAGKVALRKFMDELKTNQTQPTGRLNEDTVILKVTK